MSPDEALEKLMEGASQRKSSTLTALYETCLKEVKGRTFDFSYANIARKGADIGAPKAQSIRNKSGKDYQALIRSFSSKYGQSAPKSEIDWIDAIEDPLLKFKVRLLEAEKRRLKQLLNEIIPPCTEIYVDDRNIGGGEHRLNNAERRALEYLASQDFLKDWNFVAGPRGEIMDKSGTRVLKVGTLDALEKALKFL